MPLSRALKPDAQAFDEIRILTIPRWKESGLSGDEWRISARIQFWRKGVLVGEASARDTRTAAAHVAFHYDSMTDNGKGFFAGERNVCDQEGCCEKATRYFKLIKGYNRDGSERHLRGSTINSSGEYRCFCPKHHMRGDCGLEDADKNYVEFNPYDEGLK